VNHRIEFGGDPQDVTVITSGEADRAGFAAFNNDLVSHPEFRPGMAVLIDHSDLDASLLTGADILAIASHMKRLETRIGDGPVALLAPDAFAFGLARVSVRQAQLERLDPQTFATREEALAWLRARKGSPGLQRR
jgi:hypothetical protein